MSTGVMAIIMIVAIILFVFFKKVPMQFVLAIVPIICALLLGYSVTDISKFSVAALNNTMASVGYMLLFALMYFTLLTETGMFETIANGFLKLFKGKMNVYMVIIMTTVLSCIATLTANPATTYLIVFPIMIPLYEKLRFSKINAMILCTTAFATMCFLPWGIGIAISAVFANVDTLQLAKAALPISFSFIPVIVLQWIYFGIEHKKNGGIMSVDMTDQDEANSKVNPNNRSKLFWINLIVFIISIIALAYFKIPSYLVFIVATLATTLINYPNPKEYMPIWMKSSAPFYNTLLMLAGISVFVGIFKETKMMDALAGYLVAFFPSGLLRYIHLILLALCVIILRFIPYQVYNSLYPVFISIGAKFGLAPIDVIAPYVNNLGLGTGSSPLTGSTLVGTSLLNIDVNEYSKKAAPIQTVSNILVILICLVLGFMK